MAEDLKTTPEALINELWKRQEAFTVALNKAWQAHMAPWLARVEKARTGFTDLLRAIDNAATGFGETDAFVETSRKFISETYILGALYIHARDQQTRELAKLPPSPRTFRLNKSANETTLIAGYSLSLADEEAIAGLSAVHKTWFTDKTGAVYYGNFDFTGTAKDIIENGKSGIDVSEKLKVAIESHYKIGAADGKGLSYWAGVAEHTASTAGIAGQLNTLKGLGWSRFVIVNPMDERTTPVCQQMNGKSLLVDHGVELLEATLQAKTPDEVREIKPFVSGGSAKQLETAIGSKLTPGDRDLSKEQSEALSKAGFAMPPFHFRCRSFIDISFDAGSIAPGPEAAKYLPPDRPPAGAFPFNLSEMKVSNIKLGGGNPKFVLEAPDGSLWMYKDYTRLQSEFRVHVDVLAARVQKAAGVNVPETYSFEIPRSWDGWGAASNRGAHDSKGSLAKLFNPDEIVRGDLSGVGLEGLPANARIDVQLDHAVNWVISNGDAHYENFMWLDSDKIVGIDKAQGFKFFGSDTLAIDYVSPQAPWPSSNGYAYAENELQRYARGDLGALELQSPIVKGKLTDFGKRLQAISDIPDEEYKAIIRPYVVSAERGRGGGSGPFRRGSVFADSSVEEVLDAIATRKNNLVKDFDNLYQDIEKKRLAILKPPAPKVPANPKTTPNPKTPLDAHNMLRRGLSSHIEKAKLAGFQVFHSGADLENLGMLGFRVIRPDGKGAKAAQIHFRGRVSRDAASRVKSIADTKLTGLPPSVPTAPSLRGVGDTSKVNAFWNSGAKDDVLSFAKSFNAHIDVEAGHPAFDGVVPTKTVALYEKLVAKFDDIGAAAGTDSQAAAAIARLGFVPTEIEVESAKHYAKMLKPYKTKTGGWNENYVASKGRLVEEFDAKNFKPTKTVPEPTTTPKTPKTATKETFVVREAGDVETVIDHSWITSDGPILNSEWGEGALSKYGSQFDESNGAIAHAFNGNSMQGYVFNSATNADVELRFWYGHHSGKRSVFDREFRLVINKAKPTKKDFQDGLDLMRAAGLDVKDAGPSMEEFKVLWARKQAETSGFAIDRSTRKLFDIPGDLPAKEQLEKLKDAFDAAAKQHSAKHLAWDELTKGMKDRDYLPDFKEKSLIGRTAVQREKDAFGLPSWQRRDLDVEALRKADIYGAFSTVTGQQSVGFKHKDLIKTMFDADNAALIPTNQRSRMGIPISGMSPIDDMESGGADHIFTRVRGAFSRDKGYALNGDELTKKIEAGAFDPGTEEILHHPGIYYKRESLLTQDALSYDSDKYGRKFSEYEDTIDADKDFVSRNMFKSFEGADKDSSARVMAQHMQAETNEHIVGGTMSLTDNVEYWIVPTQDERTEIIEFLHSKGVKEFGGRKIEHVFIAREKY